ncbi:MAG: hypothetical protein HYY16_13860 [Planctomycetes bacterium]|nr:hypothetical protein [Planctomycetota bacterium]
MPIRFFLSDGSKHDVRHPEFILVTPREIVIATPSRAEALPERLVFIDPVHITRIEPINGRRRRAKYRGAG